MKKILIVMFLLTSSILFVACDEIEEKPKEVKEVKEQKEVKETKKEERKMTEQEKELWENDDKPYFLNKEFFDNIDDLTISENFSKVMVHLNKNDIRPLSNDQLFDYTNDTGVKIQEVIAVNYEVKEIPVEFYLEDELISKENEHGAWINNRMSNWKQE